MTKQVHYKVATYERANRIFSGLPVRCEVRVSDMELDVTTWEHREGPIAWSVGTDVFFAPRVVEAATASREGDVALAGLNFHELGHALYTPTPDSWMREHLKDWKVGFAFNALEDQRIETLLAAQYPTLAGYFVQAFQSFVVENTETVYTGHLLAHGRRFLPNQLRHVLRQEFAGTWDERAEAEAIIDEYRSLVLGVEQSADAERAVQLVHRFTRIIQNLGERVPSRSHGSGFGGATATLVQVDAQKARELIENGRPVVCIEIRRPQTRRPRQAWSKRPARRSKPQLAAPIVANLTTRATPVRAEYRDVARQFRTELERLRGDADAGWIGRQAAGRLNTQRAMLGADPDTVFDRWHEASFDATDIEAVLLLDASGSMHRSMTEVCAAAWAIKRAIEAVGGKVTVYSYDDGPAVVYGSTDRAEASSMRVIGASGGNEPLGALQGAREVLLASHAANRILITLADGDWGNEEEIAHEVVDELRTSGVMTAIGLLGQYVSDDPHHHEHAVRLSSPASLVAMARQLIRCAGAKGAAA